VPGSDDWCLTGEVDAFVQVSIPAVSQKAVNPKPLFELERGLGSVSGPHRGTLIDMRCLASKCCMSVDLFFGSPCKEGTSWIAACEALESSVLRSSGPASSWLPPFPRFRDRADSSSFLKISVAHPQTISSAIKSINMATNSRPFVCLRQQCPYRGANSLANMESHIMHEHDVRPWECAEAGCTVTCARR
jgi:hypothetical protein